MAKKCSYCNFENNPDNAHYCGKCGKKVSGFYETWKLYNAYSYTPVLNSTLTKYKQYEKDALSSPFSKFKKWISNNGDAIVEYLIYFIIPAIIVGISIWLSPKELTRIQIEGKYGVGYNKNDMLLSAKYDSIHSYHEGNQWFIYDKTNKLQGVAYVTDSITRVIEPKYTKRSSTGDISLLEQKNEELYFAYKGLIVNTEPYRTFNWMGYLSQAECFLAQKRDGNWIFLDKTGKPFDDKEYDFIGISREDKVIITSVKEHKYHRYLHTIHDYKGKQINNHIYHYMKGYSDGVTWTSLEREDYIANRYSVIDTKGNVLCKVINANRLVDFSEGIGFYSQTTNFKSDKFVAIDKRGNELFKIDAGSVSPFTMGLAPVVKNSKLGFIDKTGKTIIPFKYSTYGTTIKFKSDSTVQVKLNGKLGKLHRNGTFTPDN